MFDKMHAEDAAVMLLPLLLLQLPLLGEHCWYMSKELRRPTPLMASCCTAQHHAADANTYCACCCELLCCRLYENIAHKLLLLAHIGVQLPHEA
jgi:hypothetical protein